MMHLNCERGERGKKRGEHSRGMWVGLCVGDTRRRGREKGNRDEYQMDTGHEQILKGETTTMEGGIMGILRHHSPRQTHGRPTRPLDELLFEEDHVQTEGVDRGG